MCHIVNSVDHQVTVAVAVAVVLDNLVVIMWDIRVETRVLT